MKKVSLAAVSLLSMVGTAMANPFANELNPPVTAVPEISALEGTAALAALTAIVLLTWERRRRAH